MHDGSESTATKNVFKKGYHVTEATVLTNSNHPVSIFSEIHSSKEKDLTSINTMTFSAMERAAALFGKATFVMDRGYDDNKMFLKLDSMEQDYVIRLTAKLYFSRWEIEEYFRCKKQMFQFENFRVRKLKAINALNFYLTLRMAFLNHVSTKSETNALKDAIIRTADPVKEKISFCCYRLAKDISQSPVPAGLIKVPLFTELPFF